MDPVWTGHSGKDSSLLQMTLGGSGKSAMASLLISSGSARMVQELGPTDGNGLHGIIFLGPCCLLTAKVLAFPPLIWRASISSYGLSPCSLQQGSQTAYRDVQGFQACTSCQTFLKPGHRTCQLYFCIILLVKVSQAQPRFKKVNTKHGPIGLLI